MGELAVPAANATVPSGWWHTHALPALAGMDDVESVNETARKLAALSRYVKNREQRFELEAATRAAELRIGELLRLTPRGQYRGTIPDPDATKFRLLADNRDLVVELLEAKVASRRRILARLGREKARPERPAGLADVRHGDFRQVLDDLSNVDAIVTDPPYPREFLPLYPDLSSVAERILRPGGLCVVMCGQSYLPEVTAALGQHLRYRWTLAYLTGGSAAAIHGRRLQTYWKPVLVYEKEPVDVSHRIGSDVIRADGNDTDPTHHHWGQNEAGMAALIERVTEPGWLIVDPFAGGGTTLLAAQSTGRQAIGCDTDPQAVQQARERLAA